MTALLVEAELANRGCVQAVIALEHDRAAKDLPASMGPRPGKLDNMSQWKCKAISTFTMCHSVDLLRPHLHPNAFAIWKKFVETTRIALKSRITREDVRQIREGYAQVAELFERFIVRPGDPGARVRVQLARPCIHMLTHIATEIETWGPLMGYSQYTCERLIGQVKATIHSTRFPVANLGFNFLRLQINRIHQLSHGEVPLPQPRASIRHQAPGTLRFLRHRREKGFGPLLPLERNLLPHEEDWANATIQRWARLELSPHVICGSVWGESGRDEKELRRKCRIQVCVIGLFNFLR
jgi:hypothetical protein